MDHYAANIKRNKNFILFLLLKVLSYYSQLVLMQEPMNNPELPLGSFANAGRTQGERSFVTSTIRHLFFQLTSIVTLAVTNRD